ADAVAVLVVLIGVDHERAVVGPVEHAITIAVAGWPIGRSIGDEALRAAHVIDADQVAGARGVARRTWLDLRGVTARERDPAGERTAHPSRITQCRVPSAPTSQTMPEYMSLLRSPDPCLEIASAVCAVASSLYVGL